MAVVATQGTEFRVSDGASPETFVKVGEVTGVRDIRSGQAAEIDVTDFDSTAREFFLGLKDEGTMSIDLMFDPDDTGQIRLETLRDDRTTGSFRIVVPTTPLTHYNFSGLVTQFPFTAAPDEVYRSTVTIRVTGTIVKDVQP